VPPVNVWDAEHALDADQARQLLAAQFPQLALDSVEPLGVGFDNTVYLVDGAWAFRFPRREVAVPLMARELRPAPGLAPRLPLAVPVPELVGRPAGGYPWPFWGARLVPGLELADAGCPTRTASRSAGRWGLPRGAAPAGRGPGPRRPPAARPDAPGHAQHPRTDGAGPPGQAGRARELAARLGDRPCGDEVIAAADPLGPPDGEPVVVHGDLHLRHLLVGPDGLATGVIDWGDSCLADPALDLSLAFGAFSGPARAGLLAAYGQPLDEERELRARVLALCLCAALADYGDLEGHPALRAEALAGVRRAVE
jgi:aminoglycoside phosphotransferase (APT) family kinase protein